MGNLTSTYHNPERIDSSNVDKVLLYQQARTSVEKHLRGIDKIKKAYYNGAFYYNDLFRRAVAYGNPCVENSTGIIFAYLLIWNENAGNYYISLSVLHPSNAISKQLLSLESLLEKERGVFAI